MTSPRCGARLFSVAPMQQGMQLGTGQSGAGSGSGRFRLLTDS